jgi:RNA polymerase sigma-70 factor, ECF subfamily
MATAWDTFVRENAQAVLNSALRVIANVADAEDIAQEVFLEIFQKGKLLEFACQPALLRTIATRRALDRLRMKKFPCDLVDEELVDREHEPPEHAIATELDLRLRSGLARLPPREAEVFCLTYFEGNSASEIATLLGITKGAVAKSLSMARGRLAGLLRDVQSEMER